MGRCLANGILTSIFIEKRKSMYFNCDKNFDLKKQIKNILKDMDRIIDVSKYDITETENSFILNLKLDFLNDNIHDLLKEINNLTPSTHFFTHFYDLEEAWNIDFDDPDFKKKYPLLCTIENNIYTIKCNKEESQEAICPDEFYWFLHDNYLFDNVSIRGKIIPLWMDINKYDGEDETKMLEILNTMKTTYYHSELSKALIYEIFG